MSFTPVTLTGTVEVSPGVPAVGAVVQLRLSNEISDGTVIIEPLPIMKIADDAGNVSFTVPANDDETTVPAGTYYHIQVVYKSVLSSSPDYFSVTVRAAYAPTVDLFSIPRLAPTNAPVIAPGATGATGADGPSGGPAGATGAQVQTGAWGPAAQQVRRVLIPRFRRNGCCRFYGRCRCVGRDGCCRFYGRDRCVGCKRYGRDRCVGC